MNLANLTKNNNQWISASRRTAHLWHRREMKRAHWAAAQAGMAGFATDLSRLMRFNSSTRLPERMSSAFATKNAEQQAKSR